MTRRSGIACDPPFPPEFPSDKGVAMVFVEPAGGWTGTLFETANLTASEGNDLDGFGAWGSIFVDRIAISAPSHDGFGTNLGAVYLFEKPVSGWASTSMPDFELGAENTERSFGTRVEQHGEFLITGTDLLIAEESAAYVYAGLESFSGVPALPLGGLALLAFALGISQPLRRMRSDKR